MHAKYRTVRPLLDTRPCCRTPALKSRGTGRRTFGRSRWLNAPRSRPRWRRYITGFDGVIDWIIFKFGSWEFAMFNIADSCLVIGIIVFIIAMIIDEVKEVKARAKRGEYKYSPEELEKIEKEKQEEVKPEDEGNKGE